VEQYESMFVPIRKFRSVVRNVRSELRNGGSELANMHSVVRNGDSYYAKLQFILLKSTTLPMLIL